MNFGKNCENKVKSRFWKMKRCKQITPAREKKSKSVIVDPFKKPNPDFSSKLTKRKIWVTYKIQPRKREKACDLPQHRDSASDDYQLSENSRNSLGFFRIILQKRFDEANEAPKSPTETTNWRTQFLNSFCSECYGFQHQKQLFRALSVNFEGIITLRNKTVASPKKLCGKLNAKLQEGGFDVVIPGVGRITAWVLNPWNSNFEKITEIYNVMSCSSEALQNTTHLERGNCAHKIRNWAGS